MDKRYPIGNFDYEVVHHSDEASDFIESIRTIPSKIRISIESLSEEQLQTPYRENGWTPFQVLHHLGDSHLNSLIRFKLALTEDNPIIRPYDEQGWTALGDYDLMDVEIGLKFLEAVHTKWIAILSTVSEEKWKRTFHHPESKIDYTLINALAMYAWHGEHHLAHINLVKEGK